MDILQQCQKWHEEDEHQKIVDALEAIPMEKHTPDMDTMDNEHPFAENTKLCAAILTGPLNTEEGGEVCTLLDGNEVNFYQVIPLYRDEMEYKMAHDADALLDQMAGISFVVQPDRPNAMTRGLIRSEADVES